MRLHLDFIPVVKKFTPTRYFFGKKWLSNRAYIGCHYTFKVGHKKFNGTTMLAYIKYPIVVTRENGKITCNYEFSRIDVPNKLIVVKRKKKEKKDE